MEEDVKYERRAARAYRAYKRREILKSMFTRYKVNMNLYEYGNREYFWIWLKSLVCILLRWERGFDYKDNTVIVCTTDEEQIYDSMTLISCEVSRSPFVWGVNIYYDWN